MMSYELRSAQWRRVESFLLRLPGWVGVTAKETRIVFGLDDLVTVRLRCAKCQGDVSQSLDATNTMPDHCMLCLTPGAMARARPWAFSGPSAAPGGNRTPR